MNLAVFMMQDEEKCLPLPPHVDLFCVHCNIAEKLGFTLHCLCLSAFRAHTPYSCKLIKQEFEGMSTAQIKLFDIHLVANCYFCHRRNIKCRAKKSKWGEEGIFNKKQLFKCQCLQV